MRTTDSTGRDADGRHPGLFDSPWPAEDGGPRRQLVPRGARLGLRDGERLTVTSRRDFMFNMVVLRAPGQVYVQGSSPPSNETTGWVERVDPVSLETIARTPELPGGPWWPGGVAAHANGDLYVVHGRWCHRLDPDCGVVAARRLPRDAPYNSFVVLSDGRLVTKNFVRDGGSHSFLSLLDPERLDPVGGETEIPEGSIARLSADRNADGEFVYVVGDHTAFRFRYSGDRLAIDPDWSLRYRVFPDGEQSYGWDPVLAGGHAWFLDNGDNEYTRSFRGGGVASGPIRLWRVALDDAANHESFAPFDLPHGTVANPPLVEPSRRIVVCYDSGNDRLAAFRYGDGAGFTRLWEHGFGAANHFLLYPESGEIVVNDFRDDAGDHVVVLDLETGAERGRVATGSPMQSVTFQSPGFDRDVYTCSFATLSRTAVG